MKMQTTFRKCQQGVVLFIALVALVVMSLAAAALIRSVDTNTVITGNLSFQQSAILAGDSGAEAGLAWLQSVSDAGNLALLDGPNIPGQGYFATVPNTQLAVDANSIYLDDPVQLRNNATWANSVVLPQDGNGNTVSYIIERMCLNQTAPDTEHCLFGANPPTVNAGDSGYQQAALADGLPSPMYRVTVRVQGPKNTESYTQTYAY